MSYGTFSRVVMSHGFLIHDNDDDTFVVLSNKKYSNTEILCEITARPAEFLNEFLFTRKSGGECRVCPHCPLTGSSPYFTVQKGSI